MPYRNSGTVFLPDTRSWHRFWILFWRSTNFCDTLLAGWVPTLSCCTTSNGWLLKLKPLDDSPNTRMWRSNQCMKLIIPPLANVVGSWVTLYCSIVDTPNWRLEHRWNTAHCQLWLLVWILLQDWTVSTTYIWSSVSTGSSGVCCRTGEILDQSCSG
jgi:hypothetical protein